MAEENKAIDSLMTEKRTFPPPAAIKTNAYITSQEQYQQMWDKSIKEPDGELKTCEILGLRDLDRHENQPPPKGAFTRARELVSQIGNRP